MVGCAATPEGMTEQGGRATGTAVTLPDGREVMCVFWDPYASGSDVELSCDWLTAGRPE